MHLPCIQATGVAIRKMRRSREAVNPGKCDARFMQSRFMWKPHHSEKLHENLSRSDSRGIWFTG